jgi:uncharacterized membrane protein
MNVRRLRMWWDDAFWVIPLTGVVAAAVVDALVHAYDELFADSAAELTSLSPSSAVTLLASIGGGMITFTGFVFSLVLLIIQFGSSSYSPRTVSYFLRSRLTQSVLAIFVATSTYAFLALISIGSAGRESYVPLFGVTASLLFLLASLIAFIALIQNVARRIRVDALLSDLGKISRHALRRHSAAVNRQHATVLDGVPHHDDANVVVRHAGDAGQMVGIDLARVERLAAQSGARMTFRVGIGDSVAPGAVIAMTTVSSLEGLEQCVLVNRERSLRYDPLYALRLLTDVGLRALSPAINDPTTAVRALDEVEAVLRTAASLPLGPVRIEAGSGSVIVRGATWNDIVDLAIWEVLEAGSSAPQVTRRISALLDDLLADLPATRHEPLLRCRRRLRAAIAATVTPDAAEPWLVGDSQGIGSARTTQPGNGQQGAR